MTELFTKTMLSSTSRGKAVEYNKTPHLGGKQHADNNLINWLSNKIQEREYCQVSPALLGTKDIFA